MSNSNNNFWDQDFLFNTYQKYSWRNYDYPGAFYQYQYQARDTIFRKSLLVHDNIYSVLKFKDIEKLYLIQRPQAYFHNFVLNQFQKITRPALEVAGTGFGAALDKTVVKTWESTDPRNLRFLWSHPDKTVLYFKQLKLGIGQYIDAIDSQSGFKTLFNLNKVWWGNVGKTVAVNKYYWQNQLYSSAPFYKPHSIVYDKSKHLALSYYDVITDKLAENFGWFFITYGALRATSAARQRTSNAVQLWSARTGVKYLPFTFRLPLQTFVIKPPVRIFYNPYIIGTVLVYKFLQKVAQSVEDSLWLEQSDPEQYRLLESQDRSVFRASPYADLTKAIWQRKNSNGF